MRKKSKPRLVFVFENKMLSLTHSFVQGPTIVLDIPTKVIELFYQEPDALVNAEIEGYVRKSVDPDQIWYKKEGTSILFFNDRRRLYVQSLLALKSVTYHLILDIYPFRNDIVATAQRYDRNFKVGWIERQETFADGFYRIINIVDCPNSLEEMKALSDKVEKLLTNPNRQGISRTPHLLEPLMKFVGTIFP